MKFLRRSESSPIVKTDVLDAVAISPDETHYALSAIETRGWLGGDKQLREVQAKVYAYLDYIEGGQLAEDYPDSSDKDKVIILHCEEEPTADAAEFLRLLGDYVRSRGVSFEVWPERQNS